jgi:hypothetical protein
MVAMWHLWLNWTEEEFRGWTQYVKEIHMCHACATDIYGAPTPTDYPPYRMGDVIVDA